MKRLHRPPRVVNKYSLTVKDIENLKVGNRALIGPPVFWWNNLVSAWCISGYAGIECSYWIGFYSEDAPQYAGEFKFYLTSCEDMCSYNFKTFFDPAEIESDYDFMIQEQFLETINKLIDKGILVKD